MSTKHPRHLAAIGVAAGLMTAMLTGCAPKATTFRHELPVSERCGSTVGPHLIGSDEGLTVWSYRGRLYVFGSEAAGREFAKAPRPEVGMQVQGGGANGEDISFEGDASQADELQKRYTKMPKLLRRVGREYSVWKRDNRLYVIGPHPAVEREFVRSGELTLAKTFFNAGPHGETVIVEASKSKRQFADLLMERFVALPMLVDERCPDYFVWKTEGRLVVLGSPESSLRLESGRWLPPTRAILDAGPAGETVSFETDPQRPELLRRLATAFFGAEQVPAGLLSD